MFEIQRMFKKKNLLYILLLVFSLFLFDVVMELLTGELNGVAQLKVGNLSQAICQFTILLMLPVFVNIFSDDYTNKSISFYSNNTISLRKVYIERMLGYCIFTVLVYFLAQCAFMCIFRIGFNKQTISVLLLNLLVVLVSINAIYFFSMFYKKKWISISYIIGLWIGAQVINSLNIPVISGYFFPVDSENVVARYVKGILGQSVVSSDKMQLLKVVLVCFIWIMLFLILGIIISSKRMKKNSI